MVRLSAALDVPMPDLEEKIVGSLVGCAVGDALGMPVEGWPKARIQKHCGRITAMMAPVILRDTQGNKLTADEFGKIHHWTEIFEKGDFTDDTILTLAIAESIIECGLPELHHICQKQLDIYQDFSAGQGKCGFGGTTKAAFQNLLNGILPTKSGVIGGPGTGPAMKMTPIGIWASLIKDKDRTATGRYLAKLIGRSTHLDPRSVVCGTLQAAAVTTLLQETWTTHSGPGFILYLRHLCKEIEEPLTEAYRWHKRGNIYDRIMWVCDNLTISVEEAHAYLGSSSAVYQAYPFTLWMLQKYWNDPIAGLEEIVNCGGDCDTTGAMYGALVGARCGMIFPKVWTKEVTKLNKVINIAEQLANLEKSNPKESVARR